VPCTNPLTAAVAAFRALDAETIALITPYNADVTRRMAALYEERGIAVTSIASFLEEDDDVVGRIDEASVAEAVRTVAGESDADAVFVSCTSLRAFGVIEDLEADVGRPVVSSNQALSWHLLRLAGLEGELPGPGRLFRHGLPS
jgi:maleate isomerase